MAGVKKTVLLTGFEPFGGEKVNPALEAVRKLGRLYKGDTRLVLVEVPTVFRVSIQRVVTALDKERPLAVISIGQAGGRTAISLERIAVNMDDAEIADNRGDQPCDRPINPEGPAAYFATLPLRKIMAVLKENAIPVEISNSAGTFVCNHLMYGVLDHINNKGYATKAGFIHIPFLPVQAVGRPHRASMSLDVVYWALALAIDTVAAEG